MERYPNYSFQAAVMHGTSASHNFLKPELLRVGHPPIWMWLPRKKVN